MHRISLQHEREGQPSVTSAQGTPLAEFRISITAKIERAGVGIKVAVSAKGTLGVDASSRERAGLLV